VVTVAWNEELGSERVTDAEPEKGQPGALKAIREHLPFIFAERRANVPVLGPHSAARPPVWKAVAQERGAAMKRWRSSPMPVI
jgi:hypothetical protein